MSDDISSHELQADQREPHDGQAATNGTPRPSDATLVAAAPAFSECVTQRTVSPSATFIAEAPTIIAAGSSAGGAELESDAPLPLENRLEELSILGRGGFGSVHATLDHVLMRTVAKKTLDRSYHALAADAHRFIEEAQITAQLDHPNIVPIHDFSQDEHGRHYFTMKMVKGQTLTQYLRSAGRAYDSRIMAEHLEILLKVCDAISFAHSRGVVHRDLKPDNIMIGSYGQVYVMDWGIAQVLDPQRRPHAASSDEVDQVRLTAQARRSLRDSTLIIGSFAYMAPEQARGLNSKIDERTDVFALGAILYQILTDQPPYCGDDADAVLLAAMRGEVREPWDVAPNKGMPRGLVRIAMKALKAAPEERYQSVMELQSAIEQFLRGGFLFATRSFLPGEVICVEGELAEEAFIINAGRSEVFKTTSSGSVVLRTMGPGDVFGETAILTGQPRTASVRALTALTVTVIARESMEAELGVDNWMGAFVKALATRFHEADALLSGARAAETATRVVCEALSYLCRAGQRVANGVEAPWQPCLAALQVDFGSDERELVSMLKQNAALTVDPDANLIRLSDRGI